MTAKEQLIRDKVVFYFHLEDMNDFQKASQLLYVVYGCNFSEVLDEFCVPMDEFNEIMYDATQYTWELLNNLVRRRELELKNVFKLEVPVKKGDVSDE